MNPSAWKIPTVHRRPGVIPAGKKRQAFQALRGAADNLEAIAASLGGESARAIRTAADPEAALAAAKAGIAAQRAAEAGAAVRAELADEGRASEARSLARLRRSGWRALPSGEWKAPDGTICRSFEAAIRCLDSKSNRCT